MHGEHARGLPQLRDYHRSGIGLYGPHPAPKVNWNLYTKYNFCMGVCQREARVGNMGKYDFGARPPFDFT
jgi:hypothetical protein